MHFHRLRARRRGVNISPPRVAVVMLYLLVGALLLCAGMVAVLYLQSEFDKSISAYRRQMNAAAYNAQTFFARRSSLLKSLIDSISEGKGEAVPLPSSAAHRIEGIPLALDRQLGKGWALYVTERDRDAIARSGAHLVYWTPAQFTQAGLENDRSGIGAAISREVTDTLTARDAHGDNAGSVVWISDGMHNRLYMFGRVDPGEKAAGWLGLALDNVEPGLLLSSAGLGYMLLDRQDNVVLESREDAELRRDLASSTREDAFLRYGPGPIPQYLTLSKAVGEDGWRIVYFIRASALLKAGMPAIQPALGICLLLVIGIGAGIAYVNRHLMLPARRQFNRLIESEAFSRSIIEAAPVALCVLRRRDGNVPLANGLARSWLDHDVSWRDAALATGRYPSAGRELSLHDGRSVYISFAAARYQGDDVVICAFNDITAHKEMEAAMQLAIRRAEAANEAKTVFLTTMSHEIRTPLYGILGTLELLALSTTSGQQREYLKALERSSASLLQVVDNTLDISRIEAGSLMLEPAAFSPLELTEDVLSSYAARAARKGLLIYACIDADIPGSVLGDAVRVRQILNNLLSNAIKFTQMGRVVLRARLSARRQDGVELMWQVADTGVGIAVASQAHIFESYYQASGSRQATAGSGLGLSICHRLTYLMGGAIQVVSEPGLGSLFSVTLPLALSIDTPDPAVPRLRPGMVHVRSDVREFATHLCAWLRHWGAVAQPYSPTQGGQHRGEILIDALPSERSEVFWAGLRVLATPFGPDHPEKSGGTWRVNAYSVRAIGLAVQFAQDDVAESGRPGPGPFGSR